MLYLIIFIYCSLGAHSVYYFIKKWKSMFVLNYNDIYIPITVSFFLPIISHISTFICFKTLIKRK